MGDKVLEHVRKVIYHFILLTSMNHIHNVLHVSLLHKYISDLTYVFSVGDVRLEDNLVYKE